MVYLRRVIALLCVNALEFGAGLLQRREHAMIFRRIESIVLSMILLALYKYLLELNRSYWQPLRLGREIPHTTLERQRWLRGM